MNLKRNPHMPITPRKISPSDMDMAYASKKAMKFNKGRRVEIRYRDLGVQEATKGEMRAEVMHVENGSPSRPTGWHYHECDIQFLMMMKGWVKMEFPDLGIITLEEGDSIMIPGGVIHQELCSSDPMELLEISTPAKLGTVNTTRAACLPSARARIALPFPSRLQPTLCLLAHSAN